MSGFRCAALWISPHQRFHYEEGDEGHEGHEGHESYEGDEGDEVIALQGDFNAGSAGVL